MFLPETQAGVSLASQFTENLPVQPVHCLKSCPQWPLSGDSRRCCFCCQVTSLPWDAAARLTPMAPHALSNPDVRVSSDNRMERKGGSSPHRGPCLWTAGRLCQTIATFASLSISWALFPDVSSLEVASHGLPESRQTSLLATGFWHQCDLFSFVLCVFKWNSSSYNGINHCPWFMTSSRLWFIRDSLATLYFIYFI